MRQKADFVSYVQPLSRALLPVFRAGNRLENQRDFIARTDWNDGVVLFGAFDVVIRECFGRRTDTTAEPCSADIAGAHAGSCADTHGSGGGFLNALADPVQKPAPPAYSRIWPLRITTSPLMPFLPIKDT